MWDQVQKSVQDIREIQKHCHAFLLEFGPETVSPEALLFGILQSNSWTGKRILLEDGWDPSVLAEAIVSIVRRRAEPSPELPPEKYCDLEFSDELKAIEAKLDRLLSVVGEDLHNTLAEAGVVSLLQRSMEQSKASQTCSLFVDDLLDLDRISKDVFSILNAARDYAINSSRSAIDLVSLTIAVLQADGVHQVVAAFFPGGPRKIREYRTGTDSGSFAKSLEIKRSSFDSIVFELIDSALNYSREDVGYLTSQILVRCVFDKPTATVATICKQVGVDTQLLLRKYASQDNSGRASESAPTDELKKSAESSSAVHIVDLFLNSILGQEHVPEVMRDVFDAWEVGYVKSNQLAGVVLLLGPPGTGKTELAKCIATIAHGSPDELCFIECSQMMQAFTVSKLIGSPPGYVGPDSGQLTDWLKVHEKPIILFDEIEKAHEDVTRVLLRFLTDGVISDAAGTVHSGRGGMVLLTSNVGFEERAFKPDRVVRKGDARADSLISQLIQNEFSGEFLSRLSHVVTFSELELDVLERIAALTWKKKMQVNAAIFDNLSLDVSNDVYKYLANIALKNNPPRGARGIVDPLEAVALRARIRIGESTNWKIVVKENELIPIPVLS